MKYYLIAGERSGDLHASHLMEQLQSQDQQAEFRFFGGDYMSKIGGTLVKHYKEMAYMGLWEVINNLDKVIANMRLCKKDMLAYQPDVLILVDYSGFNLRIAKFAKKHGMKVHYYISPKIWAWNTGRGKTIKKLVDHMFVIFPFEKEFYKQFDYKVDYVGNPTLEEIEKFVPNPLFREENKLSLSKPIIAILPGSRKAEIDHMLHFMVSILPSYSDYTFVVAGVKSLEKSYYEAFRRPGRVEIVYDQTYDLLSHAKVALVTSGTATLETALFNVPQIVGYSTSLITYTVAMMVLKVKYISLVNIIAGREVVKELWQDEYSPSRIMEEMEKLLENPENYARVQRDYAEVKASLGTLKASEVAAQKIIDYAKVK